MRRLFAVSLTATLLASCSGCEEGGVVSLRPIIEVEPLSVDLGQIPVGVSERARARLRKAKKPIPTSHR